MQRQALAFSSLFPLLALQKQSASSTAPSNRCLNCRTSFIQEFVTSTRSSSSVSRASTRRESTTWDLHPQVSMSGPSTLADLSSMKTIDGNELSPSAFEGKITLAVNVASACGYTNSGYSLMKQVGEAYPNDVVVVAIPCNSFGMQESGSPAEIAEFALKRYSKLIITEKAEVNGSSAHPIMALGRSKFPGNIKWNFDGVFLFSRSGEPVARFGNSASFSDVQNEIEKHL